LQASSELLPRENKAFCDTFNLKSRLKAPFSENFNDFDLQIFFYLSS
jgi:hypothetical protein